MDTLLLARLLQELLQHQSQSARLDLLLLIKPGDQAPDLCAAVPAAAKNDLDLKHSLYLHSIVSDSCSGPVLVCPNDELPLARQLCACSAGFSPWQVVWQPSGGIGTCKAHVHYHSPS